MAPECDIMSRDFSVSRLFPFFEGIDMGIENFDLENFG